MFADFHTHILPGIDDGSPSVDESLAMLRMEAAQGIRYVEATPHFYPRHDYPEHFLKKREESFLRLREAVEDWTDLPRIILGAEVYYFPRMSESDVLQRLTLGESRYLLVEMPVKKWTDSMYRELERIYEKQGLTPVIAHLDRYVQPFRTGTICRRLEQLPVLAQVNGEFFTNKRTSGLALRLLRQKRIHLIGSDCHDRKNRKPDIGSAAEVIRHRLGLEGMEWIYHHEQIVLQGEIKM